MQELIKSISNRSLLTQIRNLKRQAQQDQIQRILAACVVTHNNKILMIQRSRSDDFLPGYLEIPGGNVKADEHILMGAKRELFEETGILASDSFSYVGSFDAVSPDGKKVRQFIFLTKSFSNNIRLSQEHDRYVWLDFIELEKIPTNKILAKLKQTIIAAAKQIKSPTPALR